VQRRPLARFSAKISGTVAANEILGRMSDLFVLVAGHKNPRLRLASLSLANGYVTPPVTPVLRKTCHHARVDIIDTSGRLISNNVPVCNAARRIRLTGPAANNFRRVRSLAPLGISARGSDAARTPQLTGPAASRNLLRPFDSLRSGCASEVPVRLFTGSPATRLSHAPTSEWD